MAFRFRSAIGFCIATTLLVSICADLWGQTINITPERVELGRLKDDRLQEVSGLVASRRNPGFFWCHNDSGDSSRIFLIDTSANVQATYYFENKKFIDVEDIAWARYNGEDYLLIADIGDNLKKRPYVTIYLIKEPLYDEHISDIVQIGENDIRSIHIHYAERPMDAEALFVDPVDNGVYIITKRDFRSRVYGVDIWSDTTLDKYKLATYIELPTTFVTAADISDSGNQILIKNLLNIYFWERRPGETVYDVLRRPYLGIPYKVEPQGEALAFDLDGLSFYTLSERALGMPVYLYHYK